MDTTSKPMALSQLGRQFQPRAVPALSPLPQSPQSVKFLIGLPMVILPF